MTRRKMLLMTAGATVLGLAALVGLADQNPIFADDDDEGREALIKLLDAAKINLQQGLAASEQSGRALDPVRRRVLVVFRGPAGLGIFSMTDGKLVATIETCDDADDVFIDPKRDRIYVSCGAGFLDVLEPNGATYRRLSLIPTISGARTSFLVPELDRLLVAARGGAEAPAAIWVFRPIP